MLKRPPSPRARAELVNMKPLGSKLWLPAFAAGWFFLVVLLYFYLVGPQSNKEPGQWETGFASRTVVEERGPVEASFNVRPFLFIGVLSTSSHVEQRAALRETWMSDPLIISGTVLVKFFISSSTVHLLSAEEQQQLRHQFVMVDCEDSYVAMFHKSEAILEYGSSRTGAPFVMKTDDDTLIFPAQLVEYLRANEHMANEMWVSGWVQTKTVPSRDANSLLFTPKRIWREDVFPPYPQGGGYVMTASLARFFATRLKLGHFRRHNRFEDVNVGLWIAQCKNEGVMIALQSDERFVRTACVEDIKHPFHLHRLKDSERLRCIWKRYLEGQENICSRRHRRGFLRSSFFSFFTHPDWRRSTGETGNVTENTQVVYLHTMFEGVAVGEEGEEYGVDEGEDGSETEEKDGNGAMIARRQ
ncbi:hypothetical protein QOT17_016763 [Balamuthia mandrillaris]